MGFEVHDGGQAALAAAASAGLGFACDFREGANKARGAAPSCCTALAASAASAIEMGRYRLVDVRRGRVSSGDAGVGAVRL